LGLDYTSLKHITIHETCPPLPLKPYHHVIMAIPWQLRILIIMNRRAGLNLLVHAATEAIGQWARDIKAMRMGTLIGIHTFGGRLIRHIPDKDFPMIRYAGVFSNRWKQHYL
jgi:hypothetical protein